MPRHQRMHSAGPQSDVTGTGGWPSVRSKCLGENQGGCQHCQGHWSTQQDFCHPQGKLSIRLNIYIEYPKPLYIYD
jgi:hypothetical protein